MYNFQMHMEEREIKLYPSNIRKKNAGKKSKGRSRHMENTEMTKYI